MSSEERLSAGEVRAEARVERAPFDTRSWRTLMDAQLARGVRSERATTLFARFFGRFPGAATYHTRVAQALLADGDAAAAAAKAEAAITEHECHAWAPLWVVLVKATRAQHESMTPENIVTIKALFERAVAVVGDDLYAVDLWREYIDFVRQEPFEHESERLTALRSVYHRAVASPMLDVESLWRQYDSWEQKINRVLAKGLLAEHSGAYMVARQCARELAVHGQGIEREALAVPPSGRASEAEQAAAWQRLLAFERTNPARRDDAGCAARVARTFDACVLTMRFYPHVWHDYSEARAAVLDGAGARRVLERGVAALPRSALLAFALAHAHERAGDGAAARRTLDALLLRAPSPLAFVRAMHVARRTVSLDAARRVFLRARKSRVCTWQVYVFAARMELEHANDLKIVRNIFELGLKEHAGEPRFVAHYVGVLRDAGRPQDARAVLERVLATTPDVAALPIWNTFVALEHEHGDAAGELAVEQRRAERYPALASGTLHVALERFAAVGLYPCTPVELAAAAGAHALAVPNDLLASLRARTDVAARSADAGGADADADAAARERRDARRAELAAAKKLAAELPRPDLDAMTPFVALEDPYAGAGAGHALGALLPPLRGVLERLPPARDYDGAVIDARIVMHLLRNAQLPRHVRLDALTPFVPAAARVESVNSRKRKADAATASAVAAAAAANSSAVGGGASGAPTDIFRMRRTRPKQ